MKVECLREKLWGAIGLAEKITGKNLSLPILNSVVLEAEGRNLVIRSTNLELGIEIKLPCRVSQDGQVAIPGAMLFNFLSSVTGENIFLAAVDGNLIVSSPKHKTTIKGYPVVDFPTIPKIIEAKQSFNLSSDYLAGALRSVSYSAATSLIKPEISSVCIYNHQESIAIVATDSFRLAERNFPPTLKINLQSPHLIIPIKNITEIIKVLETTQEEVLVEYNQHQIAFKTKEIYLTSRLVDGVYPDYRQIIPTTQTTQVVVLKADLLETLKLLNIFVDKFGQITINLSPADKRLEFLARNEGGENTSRLEATIEGEPVTVVLNVRYLLDCLQSINTDSLQMRFNGGHKPVVIRGVGDQSFVYLIMPINR